MNITENYPKYALSGRMEIHPCVLQDIGPLGPLPCSPSTSSAKPSKQGIGYRWPCAILRWLVGIICMWPIIDVLFRLNDGYELVLVTIVNDCDEFDSTTDEDDKASLWDPWCCVALS